MLKINGDKDASSESNNDENADKNVYGQNEAVPYTDSYANYYAQWTPELGQKYGLPQDYYQHHNKRPLKKQDTIAGISALMSDMAGADAAVRKTL